MDHSTLGDLATSEVSHRRRRGRQAGFLLLLVVVAAGLLGLLGPRESRTSVSAAGYDLQVRYGGVVRSGQPVPLEVTLTSEAPYGEKVVLAFDPRLFEHFDFQNWYPNPDSETSDDSSLTYEFAAPDGDTLRVSLDARVAPGLTTGRESHWVAVLVDDAEVVRADFSLWVMP